jgi:hypothetical protein
MATAGNHGRLPVRKPIYLAPTISDLRRFFSNNASGHADKPDARNIDCCNGKRNGGRYSSIRVPLISLEEQ